MPVRCDWSENTFEKYVNYHDEEWGVPVHDEHEHFEFLLLEGAQAGLSWATILKKREAYREAFAQFDPQKVARFDEDDIQQLLNNPGIVRNKLKIRSAVTNAQAFIAVQQEFGSFDKYIWSFVDDTPVQNHRKSMDEVPAYTPRSKKLAKDLKKRDFKFVGKTIMYAHMQSIGMVNDHLVSCFRHDEIKEYARHK